MQYNIDIATELVPVRPAAHYAMGGVRTDLHGQTSHSRALRRRRSRLHRSARRQPAGQQFAARRAGVRSARGAEHARASAVRSKKSAASAKGATANSNGQPAETERFIRKVQSLMWQYVGVVRDGKGPTAGHLGAERAAAAGGRRSPQLRGGQHPASRTADCALGAGPRGEPRRALSSRLPAQERSQVPQAFGGERGEDTVRVSGCQ